MRNAKRLRQCVRPIAPKHLSSEQLKVQKFVVGESRIPAVGAAVSERPPLNIYTVNIRRI